MKTDWTFKINFPDTFDLSDLSDKNVGKLSKFLEKRVLSIAKSSHPDVNEHIANELEEIADSLNFLGFISDKSYAEREDFNMCDDELYEHFNYYLNELYNIGDTNKLIWIQTF